MNVLKEAKKGGLRKKREKRDPPPPAPKRPRRPGYAITQLDDGKGYIMAEIGCSDADIRRVYGITESSWAAGLKSYPDIKEKLEQARAKGISSVVKKLYDRALEGDMGAIRFWLCNRDPAHWKAAIKVEAEHSGKIETGFAADIGDRELLAYVKRLVTGKAGKESL